MDKASLISMIFLFVGIISLLVSIFSKSLREGLTPATIFFAGISFMADSFGTFDDKVFAFLQNKDADTNLIQFAAGAVLVIISLVMFYQVKKRLHILNINSLFPTSIEKSHKDVSLNPFEFKEKEIDFIRIYDRGNNMDQQKCDYIHEEIKEKVEKFKLESNGLKKGFTSVASLPFVFLAGSYFLREQLDEYYELNNNTNVYYSLANPKRFSFRKTRFPGIQVNPVNHPSASGRNQVTDVVISISFTYEITDSDRLQFNAYPMIIMECDEIKKNVITTKEQLQDYHGRIMHEIINVKQTFPNVKRIHLLYAGQTSLAFELGKQFDSNLPEIIGHQFLNGSYPWGVVLNGARKGTKI